MKNRHRRVGVPYIPAFLKSTFKSSVGKRLEIKLQHIETTRFNKATCPLWI